MKIIKNLKLTRLAGGIAERVLRNRRRKGPGKNRREDEFGKVFEGLRGLQQVPGRVH